MLLANGAWLAFIFKNCFLKARGVGHQVGGVLGEWVRKMKGIEKYNLPVTDIAMGM